jgi:hypothetical protein
MAGSLLKIADTAAAVSAAAHVAQVGGWVAVTEGGAQQAEVKWGGGFLDIPQINAKHLPCQTWMYCASDVCHNNRLLPAVPAHHTFVLCLWTVTVCLL